MTLEDIDEQDFLGIPGANSCILGLVYDCAVQGAQRAVYDRAKLVQWFMKENDWDEETAEEWIGFNVEGAYVGPGTPIILELFAE